MNKEEAFKSLLDKGVEFTDWHLPKDGPARVILTASGAPDIVEELDILCGRE